MQLYQALMEAVKVFFELLDKTLKKLGIDIKYCLSDSTDGASAYHGEYNGLQKKISYAADFHIHIWCYSHVLNLVVTESFTSFEHV